MQNLEDAILSKETLSNVDKCIRETNIAVVVFHGRSQERIERNKIPEKILTFLGALLPQVARASMETLESWTAR